jgi:hypothetical protein
MPQPVLSGPKDEPRLNDRARSRRRDMIGAALSRNTLRGHHCELGGANFCNTNLPVNQSTARTATIAAAKLNSVVIKRPRSVSPLKTRPDGIKWPDDETFR